MTGYLASIDTALIPQFVVDKLIEIANADDIDLDDAIIQVVTAALKPRPKAYDYAVAPVRITRDSIYFGDEPLPGCISEGGVTLKPGGGDDCNRLTVEFLVGPVNADDPYVTSAPVPNPPTPDRPTYRFSSRPPQDDGN